MSKMERKASENVLLLGAIASGGMTSAEIQLLVDSEIAHGHDYAALARIVGGFSTSQSSAKTTFQELIKHQQFMSAALGRKIGIKAAALDYLEHISKVTWGMPDLSKLAFQDDLTKLANFRYMSLRMKDEASRAKRYGHVLSVIMIDVDHFKSFNDTYGHPEGNKVLLKVATVIQANIRDTDMAARYGGEEFVVLLPETNKLKAREIAERIRQAIQQEIKCKRPITASFGIATFGKDTLDAVEVISLADKALYESKQNGRNCVSSYAITPNVEFRANFPVDSKVSVVGSFNAWDSNEDCMKAENDYLSVKIGLAKGRYEYKFIVNGVYIMNPDCKEFTSDGYGGQNCVLTVA